MLIGSVRHRGEKGGRIQYNIDFNLYMISSLNLRRIENTDNYLCAAGLFAPPEHSFHYEVVLCSFWSGARGAGGGSKEDEQSAYDGYFSL